MELKPIMTTLTFKKFKETWDDFWKKRICAETIVFSDMERFMSRSSSNNLKLLMKGKKAEGYMEGSMDKYLTKGQKIAITSIAVIIMVLTIAVVVLRGQGII